MKDIFTVKKFLWFNTSFVNGMYINISYVNGGSTVDAAEAA